MKKITLFVAFAALIVLGCKQPESPESDDDKNEEVISLEVTSAGMEFVEVEYKFNKAEKVNNWDFKFYENENDTSYAKWAWKPEINPVRFDGLIPGHEYTLKVEVTDLYYNTYKTVKKVSTLPEGAPAITGKFNKEPDGNSYVSISWKEIGSFTTKVELYRSNSEDGKYDLIETITYPSNSSSIKDKTAEDKKTYWYKVITYKTVDEEDVRIGESKPIYVETGASVPKPIPAENIKCKKGITTLSFEWPEVTGAEKYTVTLKDDAYFDKKTIEKKEVTETSYMFRGLQPNEVYYFYITVTTEGGESGATELYCKPAQPKLSNDYNGRVKVQAEQTQALYSFTVPFEDTTDCTVLFALRKTYDEDSEILMDLGELENHKFLRQNLKPATSYIPGSSAKNDAGYLHMTVTYKDANGNDKTVKSYTSVDSFYTRNLNPPTNLVIEEISKTTATISFDEISEEEKLGKTPEYSIYAYDKDGNLAKNENGDLISAYGNSSPLTLTGLKKGTEYVFKAETSFDKADGSAPQDSTQIIGNTASGIEQKPVVTLTEVQPGDDEEFYRGVYTYIKADWNALDEAQGVNPENIVYGLEYRIFEYSKYRRPYNLVPSAEDPSKKVRQDRTYTGTDSFSDKFLVNGGNTYTVRVYAYDSKEPGDIVYSDPVKVQLEKIEDRNMYSALTYTKDFAENYLGDSSLEGAVVDFTDSRVWEGNTEIRSSSKGYYVGYLQLFGEVEQTKYLFPSYDGFQFVSFKFNFEDAIENPEQEKVTCVPKIILIDRDCFNFQYSDYGYISAVYYVIPNEQGTILQEYNDDEKPYLFERYKMPYFQNDQTHTDPSKTGLEVDESYVFNNCVYMGVKQTTAGNIGFSYYY